MTFLHLNQKSPASPSSLASRLLCLSFSTQLRLALLLFADNCGLQCLYLRLGGFALNTQPFKLVQCAQTVPAMRWRLFTDRWHARPARLVRQHLPAFFQSRISEGDRQRGING